MTTTTINSITDWDDYSQSFQSVMPSQMLALNTEVSEHLQGHVVDFGCGGGKIIPFVTAQSKVRSYTGIDASIDMVKKARWMARQFPEKDATIIHAKIEETSLHPFDSGLSINSYYTWPRPDEILTHIYRSLIPSATFVLATINNRLDMPALLNSAARECIAHPHWEEFCQHNLAIDQSNDIRLLTMDQLIAEVRVIGFAVKEAHQKLYEGGLNLLILEKI